ncbi:hypothetical protein LguiA_005306 [Lonicera macranthoides]
MATPREIYTGWMNTVILELEDLYSWFPIDIEGRTILHEAAELADSKGVTPLHLAAANGHLEVVRHLILDQNHLQGGSGTFSFLIKDNEGNTPLHMAAANCHNQVVKLFIGKLLPGYLFIRPTSSLQRCLIRCGLQALQQIVEADPNLLNGFDEEGNTLLHTATLLNNLQVTSGLLLNAACWSVLSSSMETWWNSFPPFVSAHLLSFSSGVGFVSCISKSSSSVILFSTISSPEVSIRVVNDFFSTADVLLVLEEEVTFTDAQGVLRCSPHHDDWADLDWYGEDGVDRGRAVLYRDVTRAAPVPDVPWLLMEPASHEIHRRSLK